MKLTILDSLAADTRVGQILVSAAVATGASVTRFALQELKLAPCTGDFDCWIKTPGQCRTQDAIQDICRAMHENNLVVLVGPVTFGGLATDLKKAIDRTIALAHPYFHKQDGLTRHLPRYQNYASMLFIGISERSDEAEESRIFQALSGANATNLMAPRFHTLLLSENTPHWEKSLNNSLLRAMSEASGETFTPPDPQALAQACAGDELIAPAPRPIRSATLFIGSARPKGKSTSESLARQLADDLNAAGVSTRFVHARQFINPGKNNDEGLAAMAASELLVVVAPLYVDGLPFLTLRALEQFSARQQDQPHALRYIVGLLNCGYPEAVHNHLALRMLRQFARQNELFWAGGLALGGGEIVHGRSLKSMRWLLRNPLRALSSSAQALASGMPVPASASELMARPLVSPKLYRWIARPRWWLMAYKHAISPRALGRRTYDAENL